jgi:leader peptidase (prepilin peptidase)/N-methyltransferase
VSALDWIIAGATMALTALVMALVPQRLLREAAGRRVSWIETMAIGAAALVAGLAAMALAVWLGREPWRWGLLTACLGALTVVDARFLVIPDLYVVALLVLAVGWIGWLPALVGAAIGGGLLLAVRWLFLKLRGVDALGLGDVKLMVALGALAGAEGVLWIIAAGAMIGLVVALLSGRRGPDGAVQLAPLGACAAAPALVVLALDRLGVTG